MIGNTSSQGKKPSTPTIGSVSGVSTSGATVGFTASTWEGKSSSPVYKLINNSTQAEMGTCTAPCNSIVLSGLPSSTGYTVKVRLDTTYGVNSEESATVSFTTSTPAPPPPPDPGPPPPPDPGPPPPPVTCGSGCGDTPGYSYRSVTVSGDPLGACPGCSTTTYGEYSKDGCTSFACFESCGGCPPPPPPTCPNGAECTSCGEAAGVPGQCTDIFGGCVCFYYSYCC